MSIEKESNDMMTSEITWLIHYVTSNEQADYCSQLVENGEALADLAHTSNNPRLIASLKDWQKAMELESNDITLRNNCADTLARYLPFDWHPYVTALHVQEHLATIEHVSLHQPGNYWDDDPDYPSADWRYEVVNGDTRRSYWEWVARLKSEDTD